MYIYACFFMTLRFIVSFVTTLNQHDDVAWIVRLTWLLVSLAHFAVHFLGKRFKDKFIPMMVGLFIFAMIFVMVSLETTVSYYEVDVPIAVQLRDNLLIFPLIYSILLTPSIKYICFVYEPFYLTLAIFCIKGHEAANQHIMVALYSQSLIVTFWYILQKRELKRFYE